ncbi:hypothetical protein [Halomonas sp. BM-2019]|uniref:hypothetical protein n=1 Tax=Halomonas sp. BM-2019 TaxID=2811227 RepID=UPI001B3C380A|nr:MAG: hypothetical protein J5F18_00645 [Halomonas sp. BM-2019]
MGSETQGVSPEQQARRRIDRQLDESGWMVQSMHELAPKVVGRVAVHTSPAGTSLQMVYGQAVVGTEAKA